MKKFSEFLLERQLQEMSPYLYDKRKELEQLSYIFVDSLKTKGYTKLGKIELLNLEIYEVDETGAILAGAIIEDKFYIMFRINVEERSLFVKSMQLSNERKHIRMINTSKEFVKQNIATSVYTFIANRFDLISDRVQYIGAKDLWQSIAKRNEVNVYVFDEDKKDYIRHSDGTIVKYNGKNIDENEIWGTDQKHHERLLVATKKELK